MTKQFLSAHFNLVSEPRAFKNNGREKTAVKIKIVDNEGFDPSTSRMLSVRSTN
jgi:hypothetical protein